MSTGKKAIMAYSIKQKKKVSMENPVITKNGNRYICKGHDDKGNKLSLFMSEATAKAALESGAAKKA